MNFLTKLLGSIFGVGDVAGAIAGGVKTASILAAVPLVLQWFEGHGADVLFTVTVNQAAALAGLLYVVVQIAHGARPKE